MTIFQIALSNIRQRKLKSVFIMLGLAIGIATIVSIYSVLDSMKLEMEKQMTDYGPNILITADTGEITFSYGGITIPGVLYDVEKLTTGDVSAIEDLEARPMIRAIVPKLLGVGEVYGEEVVIAGSDLKSEFSIKPWLRIVDLLGRTQGTGEGDGSGSSMGGEKLDLGREDHTRIELGEKEVILGANAAYTLGLVPSNQFELNGQMFTVKAILEKNGTAEDDQVLMNLAVAQQILGLPGEVTTIELAADYIEGSESELLTQVREVLPNARVTSLRKAMLDRDEVITRLSHFGFFISIFILLAGMLAAGLGMSAAVRERTREIGIFRAIGFRKSHIRRIILLEGMILSLFGGLFGFVLGTGLAGLAAPMVTGATLVVAWRMDILAASILLALVIGAIASVYPAELAAKLDPSEALRFI